MTAVILGISTAECDGIYPRTRDGRCHGCGVRTGSEAQHMEAHRKAKATLAPERLVERENKFSAQCALEAARREWGTRGWLRLTSDSRREAVAYQLLLMSSTYAPENQAGRLMVVLNTAMSMDAGDDPA